MKRLFLFISILMMAQLSLSGIAMAKVVLKNQYLKLYKGQVKVIKIGNVDRVAVGNGKILSTSITKKGQLIILAEKAGETLVHIWGKDGWERELKIQISESNPRSAASEIKSLLRNATGLRLKKWGLIGAPLLPDQFMVRFYHQVHPILILPMAHLFRQMEQLHQLTH